MLFRSVLLIGNVGRDVEVRVLEGGTKVATFSLATSTGGYKKQDGTEVPERTSWHNIICWRGMAEIAEKYIKKGNKLTVMGSINYRDYEDANGVKRYVTDIIAYDLVLCSGSQESSKPPITESDMPTPPPMPQGNEDLPF